MLSPLRKIINRLSRKPNLKYLQVWQRDLREDIPTLPCDIQYDFVLLPQEVEVIEKRSANLPYIHRNDINDRVAAHHKCCIATHGGETVYAAWLGVGYAYSYFLDRRLELADHSRILEPRRPYIRPFESSSDSERQLSEGSCVH